MEQPRVIGHVVSVQGFRLKVELVPEAKSPSRATLDGVQRAVAINSFLTFDIGAGIYAIGILSDLEAREAYDPTFGDELSLELTKPRRIASIQLLGTVRQEIKKNWIFDTGITVLPTLDTPAQVASPSVMQGIFGSPPYRNKPKGFSGDNYDFPLCLGHYAGDENTQVNASFNDLFSRPLAVVGNTGSGKSFTVASLLRSIVENDQLKSNSADPHVFILDINGEYANAFLDEGKIEYVREPNKLYLDGVEFGFPAWLMNGEEICDWLQASEATQEPVLNDWWAIAKANSSEEDFYSKSQVAVSKLEYAVGILDRPNGYAGKNCESALKMAAQFTDDNIWKTHIPELDFGGDHSDYRQIQNEAELRDGIQSLKRSLLSNSIERERDLSEVVQSADTPRFIPINEFRDPKLVDRALDLESNKRIEQYLMTLKLRLRTRLEDRRWSAFFNYERLGIDSFEKWISCLGVGKKGGSRVSVIDLSMLATEVLPFVCAILGRLLLETREMLRPDVRSKYPWVLVLEEAHNYARPPKAIEDRSHSLSRRAFERVAKEGRKFGLSLMVASQRPSEISPTIVSQCANFFSHRLQNPDDIDHFRRIIPKQAQRLLDQVTVLSSGEAIVFGSAVHVPSRVKINLPSKEPWSATAAPFIDWAQEEAFPIADVIENWGLSDADEAETESVEGALIAEVDEVSQTDSDLKFDDEIPF